MLTVLICGKAFIENVRKNYSHVLEMLLKEKDCALCEWHPYETSLDTAVPELRDLLIGRSEWRAVIVQDKESFGWESINKRNPFDAVGSMKILNDFGEEKIFSLLDKLELVKKSKDRNELEENREAVNELELEETSLSLKIDTEVISSAPKIKKFREEKKEKYLKASENPLTRLSIWLMGSPVTERPTVSQSWPLDLLQDDCEIDRKYFERLCENDILPSELEQFRALYFKYCVLKESFQEGSMVSLRPSGITVIGERLAKRADDVFRYVNIQHEECEYDNFCDDNMYPGNMRFAFCDVNYENESRVPSKYLSFLSFVYVMTANEVPYGTMQPNRVYRGEANINEASARRFFAAYLLKLKKTKNILLSQIRRGEKHISEKDISYDEAITLFESDVTIPVHIRNMNGGEALKAEYEIGLANDCPTDEIKDWHGQIGEINKKFVRYLREPRRAVKYSVNHDFRDNNSIDDERILKLNDEQMEDIEYRLLEEEQKMVETVTPKLFKSKEYTKKINEGDKNIRNEMKVRMSKKKILITGAVSIGSFMLGFTPLVVDNAKISDTFLTAWTVVGISMGLFVLAGLVYLLVKRRKLVKLFKNFNKIMDDIIEEINEGLRGFSKYLGHACNVMRSFSVFNYRKRSTDLHLNIMKKHVLDIQGRIESVNEIYAGSVDVDFLNENEIEPYDYDFTKSVDYVYDVPYTDVENTVDFILRGNEITVPVDYIKSVTLTREELYD